MSEHDQNSLELDEPVIVLSCARSGSTLLRFVLDAHPELACPPETNLVKTAALLAANWRMLNSPDSRLPEEAVEAIRTPIDRMFATYLTNRGRRRWCDKSLGTVEAAAAFLDIYPGAKFICLYRHCMDVVVSGIEACPWGVAGHGFDAYVGNSPGNNAAAIAHYWADHVTSILEFEQQHPGACHRIRYEDLVASPADTANGIFKFLGISEAPDIAETCLTSEHEREGPSDYKIWATSSITEDSVGRGVNVPVNIIPPPLLGAVNELLGRLDYREVDEGWNELAGRHSIVLRTDPGAGSTGAAEAAFDDMGKLLADRLAARAPRPGADQPQPGPDQERGQPVRTIAVVAHESDGSGASRAWNIDVPSATASPVDDLTGAALTVAADIQTWRAVLDGRVNLGVALRHGHIRFTGGAGGNGPRQDARFHVVADALGLGPPGTANSVTEAQAAAHGRG